MKSFWIITRVCSSAQCVSQSSAIFLFFLFIQYFFKPLTEDKKKKKNFQGHEHRWRAYPIRGVEPFLSASFLPYPNTCDLRYFQPVSMSPVAIARVQGLALTRYTSPGPSPGTPWESNSIHSKVYWNPNPRSYATWFGSRVCTFAWLGGGLPGWTWALNPQRMSPSWEYKTPTQRQPWALRRWRRRWERGCYVPRVPRLFNKHQTL